MSLIGELRRTNIELWERMVNHAFVWELGEGTLPVEKLRRYFLQDYVFLRALVKLVALGIAKAPDFQGARRLDAFLSPVLTGEEELFRRAFESLGVSAEEARAPEPLPTTAAFGAFLAAVAYEGTYEEVLTCLYVTEGTYSDWAQRLARAGKRPDHALCREWIDIHATEELADFARWVAEAVDNSPRAVSQRERLSRVFTTALRHEVRFWDMAYYGEAWE